jgi:hypothetical protein
MRAIALLLGVMITSSALQAQGTAVVSGVVQDESGAPIREALIVIDPDSLSFRVRTGTDGHYRLTVPTGRFEVRIVRIGFKPQSQTINVVAPAVELDIILQAVAIPLDTVTVRASRPGLHGIVVTRGMSLLPHEPRALRGARVEAINSPHNVQTGPDGRFSIPQLPAGTHGILVTLERFVSRVIPVTIPFDGGIEINVNLDSLHAEYQRWDEDRIRGVAWRTRRATNPATFLTLQDIDLTAKDLRDAVRYSQPLLSRGLVLRRACIYLNGTPRPDLAIQDISPADVSSIEVYPTGTLTDQDRLPEFQRGGPCYPIWGDAAVAASSRGRVTTGGAPSRTAVRSRGNQDTVVVIWTRGRQ